MSIIAQKDSMNFETFIKNINMYSFTFDFSEYQPD